nr:unnamed protein product [Callosobruchus chinensis]
MEEVTLRDLIRKRGALKAQLTLFKKFHTQFENAMQDASLADIEKARIIELELRVDKNERMFQEFDQVQTQIKAQSDDLDAQMIERDNFETTFYAIISSCKRFDDKTTRNREDKFSPMRSVHAKPDMTIFKEHRVFVKFELFGMASRAG